MFGAQKRTITNLVETDGNEAAVGVPLHVLLPPAPHGAVGVRQRDHTDHFEEEGLEVYLSKAPRLLAVLAVCAGGLALAEDKGNGLSPIEADPTQRISYLEETAGDGDSTADCCCVPTCCGVARERSSDACGRCCQGRCRCESSDPWTLFGESCNGLKVGGWLSAGIFANARGAASNGPLGFNDVGNGFTFNQFWLYAEKAADTGGCGTDWGFRVDYVFGVDGPDTQAFGGAGWDTDWNTSGDYGSAMPQLYGEFAVNDLSIKLGHFYTIIGWEVVTAPDNFFYTHSCTMYYAEPFTHTGLLATYKVTDNVTAHAGWTQGWDTGFDNTPRADTFLGGLSVGLAEGATLTWACTAGDFGAAAGDIYMNSIVLELGLSDSLTYILQHDLGDNSGMGAADSQWYGINQYLQYEINKCWAAGMRIEWFRDDDGARISLNGPASGDYYGLTVGLNWKPRANFTCRPELRYDWFEGVAGAGALPFDNGNSGDQFSGGFDMIFTY